MEDVRVGGKRRGDRVLGHDYLAHLEARDLADLRAMREEADQEEADLSYLRRLLQARLDLVQDEITRRRLGEPAPTDMVAHLTAVLTDETRTRPASQGAGRHRVVEPTNAGEQRRAVEQLVSNDLLTNLPDASDGELTAALEQLRDEETAVSERRHAVQHVSDALGNEIGRRYRDGQADVADLLRGRSEPAN